MADEYSRYTLAQIEERWKQHGMGGVEIPETNEAVLSQPQVVHNESTELIDDPRYVDVGTSGFTDDTPLVARAVYVCAQGSAGAVVARCSPISHHNIAVQPYAHE